MSCCVAYGKGLEGTGTWDTLCNQRGGIGNTCKGDITGDQTAEKEGKDRIRGESRDFLAELQFPMICFAVSVVFLLIYASLIHACLYKKVKRVQTAKIHL